METIMTAPLGGQSSSGKNHMVMGGFAVKGSARWAKALMSANLPARFALGLAIVKFFGCRLTYPRSKFAISPLL
jgi:hypothetical protein